MLGYFVTGTDTAVGKTWVASALARLARARGWTVRVYKPIESGCSPDPEDALRLARAADDGRPLADLCPVQLGPPISPHAALRLEGRRLDVDALRAGIPKNADLVLVEGAGGLFSPLSEDLLVADLARVFDLPVVIVVSDALGAINRALLAVQGARQHGLRIAAVVRNEVHPPDPVAAESHAEAIARFGQVRVLGPVPHGAQDGGSLLEPLLAPFPASPSDAGFGPKTSSRY